jgi:hypothetical protein
MIKRFLGKISGHLGFLLVLGMIYGLLSLPIRTITATNREVVLQNKIRETIQISDTFIVIKDSGTLSSIAQKQGAEVIFWQGDGGDSYKIFNLVDPFCKQLDNIGKGDSTKNIFLAWDDKDHDTLYSLGSIVRPLFLFFQFNRVLGTDGKLYRLSYRTQIFQKYCEVRALDQSSPTLLIIDDNVYPFMSSIQTGNIIWLSYKEVQPPFSNLEQIISEHGVILVDASLTIDQNALLMERFPNQHPLVGKGSMLQLYP